jgi:thiamine biosynthesis lipoprotein
VVAENGLLADGLSTALYFVEPDELAKHFDFEYAIVNEDMSLNYSPNFPAEFF